MGKRFVLEATWSGYRPGQRKVVHRESLTSQRDRFERIVGILFTDGTHLEVSVRDPKPRERVDQILGYKAILHKAAAKNLEGFLDVTEIR